MAPVIARFLLFVLTIPSVLLGAGDQNTPSDEKKEIFFDSKDPLFVSLGLECSFAWYLGDIGYRRAAFPFDWLLTLDGDRMIELIEDDFEHFFDDCYYITLANGYLVNTYYNIEFRHEHDNQFQIKYARRIERFRKLDRYAGKVFFMRRAHLQGDEPTLYASNKEILHIRLEWALACNRALKKMFPHLDFNLVIFNYSDDESEMKVVEGVLMFNMNFLAEGTIGTLGVLQKIVDLLSDYAKDPLPYGTGIKLVF